MSVGLAVSLVICDLEKFIRCLIQSISRNIAFAIGSPLIILGRNFHNLLQAAPHPASELRRNESINCSEFVDVSVLATKISPLYSALSN